MSEVYRCHDRIGIGTHAHALASRNRPADTIAARAPAVQSTGREGLRAGRAPSRRPGKAAGGSRRGTRRVIELVVQRIGRAGWARRGPIGAFAVGVLAPGAG